ncbi:hypothetical protein [Streptomyces sp. NPDC005408]|uniref:hypothetical protein n=1 Tax=Streptomyces sp. NPDC005408 TaxID=3155341 RepID=UPI0033A8833D
MEQSVDPNIRLEYAAGTDPAYIPGLMAPDPAGTQDKVPEQSGDRTSDDAVPPDDVPDAEESEGTPDDSESNSDSDSEPEPEPESGSADAADPRGTDQAENGPVFEVSDRRGSIRADRDGIRFRLDDQEADFRWDEIGAVEVKPARFGRRFTVTVHMSTRRWFDAEVEAAARSHLKEWAAELDAVLDVYFED